MRRMRSLFWIVPALAFAAGLQWWVRHKYPQPVSSADITSLKPSWFKKGTDPAKTSANVVAKAKVQAVDAEEESEGVAESAPAVEERKVEKIAKAKDPIEEVEVTDEDAEVEEQVPDRKTASTYAATEEEIDAPAKTATPIAVTEKVTVKPLSEAEIAALAKVPPCAPIEYRGDGMLRTRLTKEEWAKFMTVFHGVKGDLLKWLNQNRTGDLPDALVATMENRVRDLRIQRPPSAEEPDLSWRGIGVYTLDTDNEHILRIGGGFVKLVLKDPARGKFELARLVAQSWAPCELAKTENGSPWNGLLECMNLTEAGACGAGTFSEGGWAVSSALAAAISKPGCAVPAFKEPAVAACLKRIQIGVAMNSQSAERYAGGAK